MRIEIPLTLDEPDARAMLVVAIPGSVLSAKQVARAFGVPNQHVLRDIAAGRLRAAKDHKTYRVAVKDAASLYLRQVIDECGDAAKTIASKIQ